MKRIVHLTAAVLLLSSCGTLEYENYAKELVVEGWIDSDGYPVVLISRTIPAKEEDTSIQEIWNYTEYFAKVSLSDGEKEVWLVGKPDKRYTPSYQYTTTDIKGEVGKTYTISIRTEDSLTATCKSRISKLVPLDSLWTVKNDDGSYSLRASFRNSISDSLYYHFFVLVEDEDEIWRPSLLGTIDGSVTEGTITSPVNKGTGFAGDDIKLTYDPGSRVHVKFCTMDRTMFGWWTAFDNAQTISANPFVPSKDNLPNVVNGAKGYWTGYGTYETVIDIPKD